MQEQACWVVHKLLMKCCQILGFYGLENSANQRALLTVYSIFPLNLTIFISLFPSCILLFTYLLSLSLIHLKPTNYFVWNIFRVTVFLSPWLFSHWDKAWDDLFHISLCLQPAFILMRLHISCIFGQCFWTSLIVTSLRPCKWSPCAFWLPAGPYLLLSHLWSSSQSIPLCFSSSSCLNSQNIWWHYSILVLLGGKNICLREADDF